MDLSFSGNVTLLFIQDLLADGVINSAFVCAILVISVRRSCSFPLIKKRWEEFLITLNLKKIYFRKHLPVSDALLYNSVCPYKTQCQSKKWDGEILSVQKHSWTAALVLCRESELSGIHA